MTTEKCDYCNEREATASNPKNGLKVCERATCNRRMAKGEDPRDTETGHNELITAFTAVLDDHVTGELEGVETTRELAEKLFEAV